MDWCGYQTISGLQCAVRGRNKVCWREPHGVSLYMYTHAHVHCSSLDAWSPSRMCFWSPLIIGPSWLVLVASPHWHSRQMLSSQCSHLERHYCWSLPLISWYVINLVWSTPGIPNSTTCPCTSGFTVVNDGPGPPKYTGQHSKPRIHAAEYVAQITESGSESSTRARSLVFARVSFHLGRVRQQITNTGWKGKKGPHVDPFVSS